MGDTGKPVFIELLSILAMLVNNGPSHVKCFIEINHPGEIKITRSYRCEYPGCDIISLFCKMLPPGESE